MLPSSMTYSDCQRVLFGEEWFISTRLECQEMGRRSLAELKLCSQNVFDAAARHARRGSIATMRGLCRTDVDLYATAQKKKPRSHREMRPGFVMRRSALFAA